MTCDDDQTQLLFAAALVRRARLLLRAALVQRRSKCTASLPPPQRKISAGSRPPHHTRQKALFSARSHSVTDQRVDGVVKIAIGEKCPDFARVGAFGLRSPHAEPKSGCPRFPHFCRGALEFRAQRQGPRLVCSRNLRFDCGAGLTWSSLGPPAMLNCKNSALA